MLIDEFLGEYDETRVEHLVIDAPVDVVFRIVREMDFLAIKFPVVNALMTLRDVPARLGRRVGHRPEPAPPPAMRLADLFDAPSESRLEGWVGLGERGPDEIVFGAVGKVWQPDIEWRTVPADQFAAFDAPDYAKIAASLSARSFGPARTLLSYEARTKGTDARSTERVHRYWSLVSIFVGVVMRGALKHVRMLAESARPAAAEPAPVGAR